MDVDLTQDDDIMPSTNVSEPSAKRKYIPYVPPRPQIQPKPDIGAPMVGPAPSLIPARNGIGMNQYPNGFNFANHLGVGAQPQMQALANHPQAMPHNLQPNPFSWMPPHNPAAMMPINQPMAFLQNHVQQMVGAIPMSTTKNANEFVCGNLVLIVGTESLLQEQRYIYRPDHLIATEIPICMHTYKKAQQASIFYVCACTMISRART